MAQKSAKDLVAEASREIETLSGQEAMKLVGDPNVVFVDVREGEELQKTGKLQGAVHVPRGFLEFQVDPTSPTHKPELGSGKKLGVWSRDEVVRVDFERGRVFRPSLADGLERGSPSEPLQVLSEVIGHDEGLHVV